MSASNLFFQTSRETPSVPVSETVPAPRLLSSCCACGRIYNEAGATHGRSRWVTTRTYRKLHGVSPAEVELSHTYCPKCFAKFQETVRQFFRKTG